MSLKAADYNKIFDKVIATYHVVDDVYQPFENIYTDKTSLEFLLYRKCWIDTVQWHYEDIVRLPDINPEEGMDLKRKIDASNQDRTDMVEFVDSFFLQKYADVTAKADAKVNSESPAWAIDRLSILALKIYHMNEEVQRADASESHKAACQTKLDILLEQRVDLSTAIDDLLTDIANGDKYMKVYKQMKMYNDEELNPMLYNKK